MAAETGSPVGTGLPGSAASFRRAHAQLILTMGLWGSGFVISKKAVEDVPHSVAALLRFGSGAVVLLALLPLVLRDRPRLRRSELGPLVIAGALGTFAYNALLFFGLSRAPAIDGSIIVPVLSPILTTAAAVALRWETPGRLRVAGLAVGAVGAGVFLLSATGGSGSGTDRTIGELAYVAAAASWSAYTMVGKHVLKDVQPFRATAWSMGFGALMLGVVAVPDLGRVPWSGLHGSFYATMFYLVALPTVVAYGLFYVGVRDVGPTAASVLMFLVPVSGMALSWLLLDESVDGGQLVGSLAMLGGAVLATIGPHRTRAGVGEEGG